MNKRNYVHDLEEQVKRQQAEIERLRQLCKASYHLFMGSDVIYDPRGDTGPTHWLQTRDDLLPHLKAAVDAAIKEVGDE